MADGCEFALAGYKPVDKAVVASTETAEAIEALRRQLESGEQTLVNSDGTVHNPRDKETSKDSLSGGGFKPVDKAVVAQWYKRNPDLQLAEIHAMLAIKPDVKFDYLPNGKMYWTIRLRPVICGQRNQWN